MQPTPARPASHVATEVAVLRYLTRYHPLLSSIDGSSEQQLPSSATPSRSAVDWQPPFFLPFLVASFISSGCLRNFGDSGVRIEN
ncbi:uncharacterized protein PAN0_014d4942 [Moesziomyces antarcticus]|uniref:Uncharacterized protein n=1 Tax=Pseudozyma antarctica TaxID=84753 RepID=A0A081CJ73_PSEA2|nr:uncharacterized protein PAN0_014d4942 [Moesziomyces antarcticus]GAK66719.1 hypothetical protein PAN0_014d4942 [Moesziomyces antarcticus]